MLGVIFAVFGGTIVLLSVVCLVVYVMNGIGTTYVLRQLEHPYPWLAWIPLGRMVALGMCAVDDSGEIDWFGLVRIPNILLILHPIIGAVVGAWVPFVGRFCGFAILLIGGGIVYSIIYSKMEQIDVSHCYIAGYLSSFVGIVASVKFLLYRKHHTGARLPESD